MSDAGGFRQRSVQGLAERVKEPIHSGTASEGRFKGVKDELSGDMAKRCV